MESKVCLKSPGKDPKASSAHSPGRSVPGLMRQTFQEFGGWKSIICTQDGIQTHHQMHKTEIREGGNDKLLQNSGDITVISEAFCPTVGPDVFSRRRRKNVQKRESFCSSSGAVHLQNEGERERRRRRCITRNIWREMLIAATTKNECSTSRIKGRFKSEGKAALQVSTGHFSEPPIGPS